MRNFTIFLILVFGAVIYASAQQPISPQVRTPTPAEEARQTMRQQQEINSRFENLRNTRPSNRANALNRRGALHTISNIYRKPTKDESKLVAPEKEDLKKYGGFLSQSDTGLIRLLADRGCSASTSVVNASAECLKYSMPGAGSSYSFRTKNYRIPRLSDLTYINNVFQSSGILSHAIFVNVGNIPIEKISLQTEGLKFLNDFETVSEYEKAKEIDLEFMKGVENNGFIYRRSVDAVENATYILRSIAYRGNNYRAIQGLVYDEFDFDERRDITVAFRIVRRDNESVTILWKKLTEQKSPVIKRQIQDERRLEENKFTAKDEIGKSIN